MDDDHEDGKEQETPAWMPAGCECLADGEYDAIVMGTGLKECIMSGLLSTMGKKVLHVDRNNYYGADSASLNLSNLYAKYNGSEAPEQFYAALGHNRDYNVDLIPKCIMACGTLVKMLLHTKVTRYLEFKSMDASYVYRNGKVLKVPVTISEVLTSSLLSLFEKRRFRKFLVYISTWDAADKSTHEGRDLTRESSRALFEYFGLEVATQEFVGHAMALRIDDSYLAEPAAPMVEAVKLYCYSLDRYGKSPYIYPMYGLGGLPEGFSRLCAIHGGTFMLNTQVDEVLFGEDGKAWGVKSGSQIAKAPIVIGDPSYFLSSAKCRKVGRVVRSICFLNHPIPNTKEADSLQIILPSAQLRRTNDIYVVMVSNTHQVAAQGKYIAICSTTVETDTPERELAPALALLGPIITRFDDVVDLYEPLADGKADNCYISKSFDATSHFETSSRDVLDLYERITGEKLDLNINADSVENED